MKITHHLDAATLMSYAAGSLPEALGAVVAAHLDVCPACAAEARFATTIGAGVFERLEPVAMSPSAAAKSAIAIAAARQEGDSYPGRGRDVAGEASCDGADVPRSLHRFVGPRLDEIRWKRLGLGIWHVPLPLSKGAQGDLRLIKVAPGQIMPEHGHGASELTLVLAGSYRDEVGEFKAGDIADLGDDVDHTPVANSKDGCICLIACEERARFKGLFARMVQPLTGL
ncbi:MAG: ChrR family anti-sigma-E factor [Hyphomicrobiaceae bacterium]|nr:ChrR family anti-sigma-E factor [Hyphomicrobiaceae bacterium]